jgi:hypothetical protein
MAHLRGALLILAACTLAGCSSGPSHPPVIGEAYAGPAVLKLRREIDPRSPEVATVPHGERLRIIGVRRRFVRVLTSKGVEGWTDARQLLSVTQLAELKELAETAQHLPSQGSTTVYGSLNVHTAPNRQAPSFYQLKEGELADVVAHEVAPRVPFETRGLLRRPRRRAPAASRAAREAPRTLGPPMPAPPKVPNNWLELSKTSQSAEPAQSSKPAEPSKPVPSDDWTLLRLKDGQAGWVLTAGLKMNIPDEVAEYSEGHRITSFFATADVKDGHQTKHNWLWTTIKDNNQPYEFDSFRYFIWNPAHHRYETAYVEHNLKGFYPVELHPVQAKVGNKSGTYPGFSLIVEQGGVRYRRTYLCQMYVVRLLSKERIEAPRPPTEPAPEVEAPDAGQQAAEPAPVKPSLYRRIRRRVARWFGTK